MVEITIRVHTFVLDVVHAKVSLPLQIAPKFWKIPHYPVSPNQYFFKIRCGIFLQEPCHKLDEECMAVFWYWSLTCLPLWCLSSSSISCWWRVRVWTLCHWDGTSECPIYFNITPVALSMLDFPVVFIVLIGTLPWYCDRIQKFVALNILDQTSQISHRESSCSFICEIIGSKPLVEKQSCLFQDLPSDEGTPNLNELGFDGLGKRVVQHPP